MYVVGNPIRYDDPTRHAKPSPDDGGCYRCTPPTGPHIPPTSPRPPRQPVPPQPPQEPGPIIIIPGEIVIGPIIISPFPLPEEDDNPTCKRLREEQLRDELSSI